MSTGVNNNIKSTRITFETLTITSDMVPEDDGSAIRIKTIELPSGAADLCGNEFANSTIEVQNAPRQQEWLDTVAPNVAASGATEEESYYGDGSEPVLGFRVFAQITDKGYDTSVINSANSDKYISGTNAVGDGDQAQESGVIILNNAAGAASVPYEYSVTTTPDAPTDGWQRAVTGEEAAFTQIDAGVYIHIRLTKEEGGGITEPVLTVMGYDYAGNYTTQEIQVGIQLKDTIAPKTDALMQLSVYDSASVSGNITAFDYSGLSAVKYKIDIIESESSDFSAPETPSIEEAAADTGLEWIAADLEEISTSVDIFVPETQIKAGKNNCVYVHVYAADIFGNAVVETYSFNYNLMLPSFTVSVPQGISDGMISISKLNKEEAKNLGWAVEKIQNINFEDSMANDPGDVSYIQSYGSLYVVVRDPVTEEKIGMFVDDLTDANNEFNTYPSSYEPVSKAPFEYLEVTDLLSQLRPTEDGNTAVIDALSNTGYFAGGMMWQGWGIDFENSLPAENTPGLIAEFAINDYRYDDMEYEEASKEAVNALAEKFSSFYGELEIYTMAIDSKWFLQQNHNNEAEQDLSWIRFFQMPDTERRASGKGGNDFKPIMVQKYTVKSARDNGSDKPINTAAITSIRGSSGKIINDDDPRLESSVPAFSGTELDRFRTLSGVQISFRVGNDRVPDWGIEDIDFENSYITVYKDGASFMTQSLNADSADQLFVFPNEEEYGSGTYSVTVTLCAKISGRVDEIELGKTLNVDAAAADADGAFKNITINIEDPAIGKLTVKDGITENTPIESVTVPFRASYQYLDYDSETIDTTEGSQPVSKIKMWISGSEDEAVFVNGKRIQLVYQEEEKAYIRNNAVYVPNGQTTTLCYQEVLWNGETSPIRQIAITAGGEGPVSEFEVMPGTISQSAQIKVNSLYSANGDISAIYAFKNGDNSALISCEVTENGMLSIGGQDTFTEPDKWTFMVIDEFGTFSYDANEVLDLGLYIDSAAPELNVTSRNTGDGAYSFTLSAADAMSYADAKDLKLYISTKDPNTAAADPEPSESEGTEQETEIDDSMMVFDWALIADKTFGDGPNAAGIYDMNASYTSGADGHNIEVSVSGQIPQEGSLYVWAEDAAGNVSQISNIFSGAQYTAPKVTDISRAADGSLALTFSSGVRMLDPIGNNTDTLFGTEKTGVAIYTDGIYNVTYQDIFGNEHTESIEVALDGDFGINYEMTPSARTNGNVTLTISSARDDGLLSIADCTVEGGGDYEVQTAGDGQSASVVMKENGTITFTLRYGSETRQRVFTVNNIDRETGAKIVWDYAETIPADGATSTDGSVTAHVKPTDENDELTGLNGALSYTFASGSAGDSYTFEFMDQAGNTGSIEAVLPVDITLTDPLSLSYDMEIFAETNSQLKPYDSYTYDAAEPYDFGTLPSAQSYMISIAPNVSAKLLLLPAGTTAESITDTTESTAIEGVTITGRNITVSSNVEFVIGILADANVENYDPNAPRAIAIPVNLTNISSLGDVGIIYANLSNYARRAYLDPKGQDITVTNTTGVGIENEHQQYQGYYYHDFTQNGSFVFYYRDSVGNTGSVTAIVNDILEENIAPQDPTTPLRWWPYKVMDADGTDQSTLSESPVNFDVTAQVRFNMNVTEAALCYEDGTGFGAPVEAEKAGLNVTLDLVDITYRENIGNTVLVVTGENGTTYELHINEVGIIDKTPAEIAVDYTPGTPRQSADIIFTPNEEVLCSQIASQVWFGPENPLTLPADENGTYEYSFTDSAGNISKVSVEVTDIDHTAPVLSFSLTNGGQEYSSWNELAAQNDVSNIESAYIRSSEDGSYTFQETSGTITAGTWTQLAIEKTGVYNLTVKDTAGNVTATALNGIVIPDSEPPVIWLSPTFISVPQGSSGTELDTLMRQGIVVSDNTSSAANVTVTWDAAALNTGVTGQYIVTYTAADEAGNTSSADRTVRVFGSDDVLLGVNDKDTTYMGTLMLDTGELNFEVGNLKNSNGIYEPYMLYIKKGYKTAGQMKNNSTLINDNRVTVSGSGFYTVYLMTQSRRQYITYLYIEQ